MKKLIFYFILSLIFITNPLFAADSKVRQFQGSGEVITVDPVYSQVTIQHKAIKDFAGDTDTEFFVTSSDMLKNIQKGDLVDFEITDNKGDVKITKISKTGVATHTEMASPLGETVNQVLQGTGEVVRGVVPGVGEPVGNAASATGDAIKDVPTDSKTKF